MTDQLTRLRERNPDFVISHVPLLETPWHGLATWSCETEVAADSAEELEQEMGIARDAARRAARLAALPRAGGAFVTPAWVSSTMTARTRVLRFGPAAEAGLL